MPQLPTYSRSVLPSATNIVPRLSGADGLSAGLIDLGRSIGNVGDKFARIDAQEQAELKRANELQVHEQARAWSGEAAGANMLIENEQIEQTIRSAPADGAGIVTNYLKGFDERASKLVSSAPDEKSRNFIRAQLQQQRNAFGEHAQRVQFARGDASVVTRHTDAIGSWSKVVAQDPTQFARAMATLDETRPQVKPEVAAKLQASAVQALTEAAADHMVLSSPDLLYAATGRALNIQQPAPKAPTTTGVVAPSAGGPEWDAMNAEMAGLAAGPERLRTLRAEANDPKYDDATRASVRREIERVEKANAMRPAPEVVATPDAEVPKDGRAISTGVPFIDMASVDQLVRWRQAAHAELQRGRANERTALVGKVRDVQSMVLAGVAPPPESVPKPADFERVYGEAGAQQYSNEITDYIALGEGLRRLQSTSGPERRLLVDGAQPVPGEGFEHQQRMHGAMVEAAKLIEKQLATDPAAYALRVAPSIAKAQQDVQSAMTDGTPEAKRQAIDAYANVMLAEQERLGVPSLRDETRGAPVGPRMTRLLTNGQANEIASQVASSGANAAQVLDGLASQWGRHWPRVYAQLAADDKLPPMALVLPNMSDPFAKERLARWSASEEIKGIKARLPDGAERDIDSALLSVNEGFYNSLAYQDGGTKTYGVVSGQQRILAMGYVSQGKSAKDAARQAFEETVGHGYQFEGTLRIPKAEQPSQIAVGAREVLKQADALDMLVPPARPGLTSADARKAWVDVVRNQGFFITNGDESGVLLYANAQTSSGTNGVAAVLGSDGRPMSFTWAQLRRLYSLDREARGSGRRGVVDRSRLRTLAEETR